MDIKRNIYYKIAEWKKETNGTKALLIEGARRAKKWRQVVKWSVK